ncbi:MAG: FKBP-type peptidyl-prolyl cis-trans isomerase [Candidatus Cryptobacteroides sp.]
MKDLGIRIFAALLAICAASLISASCTKQKLELTYSSQESYIDKYITAILDTAKTGSVAYRAGSSRVTTVQGEGEELKENGTLSFYYAGYTFKGSLSRDNLFCTNNADTAAESKWSLEDQDFDILTVNLAESGFVEGLRNGLVGVKAGEECQILFSGKYGFGKKPFGIIPANSALLYKIWVKGISNE